MVEGEPHRRQVGEREGLAPFIVIAYDAERRPLVLLPLTLRHAYGARCASFMGGKHSTFNMALFDRDFAASATQADLEGLISAISQRSEADVLALQQQPAGQQLVPAPPQGQGTQAAVPARLSQSRCVVRG